VADASLPVDAHLPAIVERLRSERALIVSAAPGAGKTTRIPPALAADGPVLLLQPRRVAARSIARRIASERGWTVGREVGWHVRFERRFGDDTRVLVATEGILTARAQADPLLSEFRTIVLDEFHERTIHSDLGIAVARQAWLARDDLRIVVMSATLEPERTRAFLGGCDVVTIDGRTFPVDVEYASDLAIADAVAEALARTPGDVLCFLPGAPEIERERAAVLARVAPEVEVLPLHGSLDAAAQDAVFSPGQRRRVILATNIAETSLTVPRVNAVVDAGWHKVARYDPDRAIDSLTTERISQAEADQRAGRAARLGPGRVWRLWDRTQRLRDHREPDIRRIDLAGPVLDVLAWGGDPRTFEWFEAPPASAFEGALALLERLGAVEGAVLTPLGRRMARLPLPPRLARVLIAANGARPAALACALLSERVSRPRQGLVPTTENDLAETVDREATVPPHVRAVADRLQAMVPAEPGREGAALARALLAGYPDRVARRRAPGSPRVLLASGHGAAVGPESGVREAEFLVALDVTAARREDAAEAKIRLACAIAREWLEPTEVVTTHQVDQETGVVRAVEIERYGAIVLRERPAPLDQETAADLLAAAWIARGPSGADEQLLRRLRFAAIEVDLRTLVREAAHGCGSVTEIDLASSLPFELRRRLDIEAPPTLSVPSGRTVRLDYREDGAVTAAVKLQELFGLEETPRIGLRREPVLLELLAPNGRPVQLTRDLRSFWERTYPDVRRELRGRYPKHPWPEDPWTAEPTARTVKRRRG
jgi:ATP-dependent helicase HrpB